MTKIDEVRRRTMRAVKSTNTTPELAVQKLVRGLGYRLRMNVAKLPGKPDIVVSKAKAVIFVHGCFWHGHLCRRGNRPPKNNAIYWSEKISRNRARDKVNQRVLRMKGWRVLTVWECQLNAKNVSIKISKFLVDGLAT